MFVIAFLFFKKKKMRSHEYEKKKKWNLCRLLTVKLKAKKWKNSEFSLSYAKCVGITRFTNSLIPWSEMWKSDKIEQWNKRKI